MIVIKHDLSCLGNFEQTLMLADMLLCFVNKVLMILEDRPSILVFKVLIELAPQFLLSFRI